LNSARYSWRRFTFFTLAVWRNRDSGHPCRCGSSAPGLGRIGPNHPDP
jgi:hypothetical protein